MNREEIIKIIKNRQAELLELIKTGTYDKLEFAFKVRYNELCKLLNAIGYEEPEPSLEELLAEYED